MELGDKIEGLMKHGSKFELKLQAIEKLGKLSEMHSHSQELQRGYEQAIMENFSPEEVALTVLRTLEKVCEHKSKKLSEDELKAKLAACDYDIFTACLMASMQMISMIQAEELTTKGGN